MFEVTDAAVDVALALLGRFELEVLADIAVGARLFDVFNVLWTLHLLIALKLGLQRLVALLCNRYLGHRVSRMRYAMCSALGAV